jgi:8-oxo-dGTP diphosphatase
MTRVYPATPRVGVLAVVRRGERLLLVRRRNPPDAGKWGFPGGAQELGETIAEAAARELREETGVMAEPGAVLDVIDVIEKDAEGRVQFHYALVAMLMEWRDGEGAAADDIDALAWVRLGEIEGLLCSDRVGAVAARALDRGLSGSPVPVGEVDLP